MSTRGLKRSVVLELCGEEVAVPVTMRVVAVIEQTWDPGNAYTICAFTLANSLNVKRTKVAECILEWLRVESIKLEASRSEIKDFVITAPPEDFNRFVGAIQAAGLSLMRARDTENGRVLNDEQFELLANGEDVGKKNPPKPPADSPSDSSTSSTTSA